MSKKANQDLKAQADKADKPAASSEPVPLKELDTPPAGETAQSLTDEPVDGAGHSKELHPELAADQRPMTDGEMEALVDEASKKTDERVAATPRKDDDTGRWPWRDISSGRVNRARYLADQGVIEVDRTDEAKPARHRPCKPTLWDAFLAYENPGAYYDAHIMNVPRD